MKFFTFFWLLTCLIFAQNLLLLEDYEENKPVNLSEFVMSEKLDGVRAFWDGKRFISRGGFVIKVPNFLTHNFPPFELDGELWIQRKDFEGIASLIQKTDISNERWHKVSFNVFDVPNACALLGKERCGLLERLRLLQTYLQEKPNPNLKVIPQIFVRDETHLHSHFEELLALGAEGLVLRKEAAMYEYKRSKNALKLKPHYEAECEVVGFTEGKNRLKGKVGAILCKGVVNQQVQSFKIGSGLSDEMRENPPKIGTIITYKFSALTKHNKPKFPVFLREKKGD